MNHTVPAWTYRAPMRPEGHDDQCYYRGKRWHHIAHGEDDLLDDEPLVTLFRFVNDEGAELTINIGAASVKAKLGLTALVGLRDALNDALADIAAWQKDRELRESFERISEELREAAARGESTGVLYAHPDVHYVAPGQVAAKVAELEAAGASRYIVLPIDPIESADDARSTRHYPSLEDAEERAA